MTCFDIRQVNKAGFNLPPEDGQMVTERRVEVLIEWFGMW